MSSLSPDFIKQMAILRSAYLNQLEARVAALQLFVKQCTRTTPTSDELDAVRIHVHSLAGSGSTYGFADISTNAKALEHEILEEGEHHVSRLLQHATDTITACKQALLTRDLLPRKDVELPTPGEAHHKILVVDDDPSITILVRHLLQDEAYVVVAHNGEDAWKILAEFTPDLVILDGLMPIMGGLELLERMRASPSLKAVPAFMLTASSSNVHFGRAATLGIVDFIAKPFSPEMLLERVRKHMVSKL